MLTEPNQRVTTVKNQDTIKISVDCWKNSENKLKIIKIILETRTLMSIPPTRTAMSTILTTTTETVTEPKESQKLLTHPVRHVARQTIPQRNAIMEPMQPIDRLPGRQNRKDKIRSTKEPIKMTQMKLLRLQPKIQTESATSSLRSCNWQTGGNSFNTSTNARGCLAAISGDFFN